jgi:hypothetical protein
MSTYSELNSRTIIVHQAGPNFYNVTQGDKHIEGLTEDECLWQMASLLMNAGKEFAMQTISEKIEVAVRQEKKKYQRPFERLIT